MQLAGNLFLDRSDRSFPPQSPGNAALPSKSNAATPSRQIFTMYANQVLPGPRPTMALPRPHNFISANPSPT